ncbi:hypothetical protein LTR84_007210 [Exophiala bonariae]|uniref:Amino acid permease/ SLC12A domain-containing protein n=1 Tax=Exophiala bonariae TaxID=1690606 RepID=A0AAV9MZ44_9EURO|nr:hypothetical protein LTR84_007210 [Exophiala bonariae]
MSVTAKTTHSMDNVPTDNEKGSLHLTTTDDARLAQLGHVQELKRTFSLPKHGDLADPFHSVISFIGTVAIATSLAELASIFPTAGGQYHWVAALSPPSHRQAASWFTGWISIGGQICLTASAAFAGGLQLRGIISLNDDSYVPKQWQGLLFYWAVLLYALLSNLLNTSVLAKMNLAAGVLHVVGFLALTAVIGAMSDKHSASYVFTEVVNSTGWASDGLAWLIGMLSTVYPFLGYDAAAHMAEEIPHAARNVPIAMVGSVVANGLLGFIYCLVLLFGSGDLSSILETNTGFPFMQLFLNVTKSRAGAIVMSLVPTAIAVLATAAGLASTSRTFWAFARDDAVPAPKFWSHVNKRLDIPVRMVLLVFVLQVLLGFLYLGSTTAFNAVLAMAIIGMYLSYALPIVYMLFCGRGSTRVEPAPFRMSRKIGIATNIVALLWLVLAIFFSTWPNFYPVTLETMNWSIVVLAGWVVVGAVYYVVWGRKIYEGPIVDAFHG